MSDLNYLQEAMENGPASSLGTKTHGRNFGKMQQDGEIVEGGREGAMTEGGAGRKAA